MLQADADRRVNLTVSAIEMWIDGGHRLLGGVASQLLRAEQKSWTVARLTKIVEAAAGLNRPHPQFIGFNAFPHKPLISAVERAVETEDLSAPLRAALERWQAALMPRELTPQEEREFGEAERVSLADATTTPWSEMSKAFATMERLTRIRTPLSEERKLLERIATLLAATGKRGGAKDPELRIDTTDAVGIKIACDVAKGGRAASRPWAELLLHARQLADTKPKAKWSEEAARLVAALKPEDFGACVSDWFNEAGTAAPQKLVHYREVADATLLNDCSVELLKGLAWTVVAARRANLAPALGNLAEACCKKVPGIGPRNVKVGNAAIAALAALEDSQAAAQLSRLRLRVKHPSSRATVDKALAALSQKTGISPDDLAEMSAPTFGLDAKGRRRMDIGKCVCEMQVISSQKVELCWQGENGRPLDSTPAIVRKQFAEELKRLQREAKDASTMIAAQSLRLERSYLSERSWPLEVWKERFLQHPLVGTLARRLIWQFEGIPASPVDGEFLTASDHPLKPGKKAVISLWHPMQSAAKEVLAWREWLERRQITQPFKQAHREIYTLTDAERQTEAYSNRFAAHILRQHQFAALCQQRGWDYHVQGDFDSHNIPTLNLPGRGLKAEFWVEPVEHEISPQGIHLYVTSDQVRFGKPLADVPPVVFSELMRDVDLFVGVASVANDPTWHDKGPSPIRTHWENWGFGELSESSRNRKAILENLLPRLAESQKFSLEERFLIVRGQLRTYRIHLGSGNILMEPNAQYLCIVPDRGAFSAKGASVFLPFEGDTTLFIILSKALLLAADDKIKDQTIVRQIKS